MNAQHTPGPWKTMSEDWNTEKIHSSLNGLVVATITHPHGDDEAQANARLIAKAPEMLEALKEVLDWTERTMPEDWLEHASDGHDAKDCIFCTVTNIIHEAEGE